jgi:hypothetical protein
MTLTTTSMTLSVQQGPPSPAVAAYQQAQVVQLQGRREQLH